MIHILKKLPDSDRQSIKEILTIIILAVFLFQGCGIGYHLSTMNNELSTNHTLRPVATALSGGTDSFDFEHLPIWQKIPQELRGDLRKVSVFKNHSVTKEIALSA